METATESLITPESLERLHNRIQSMKQTETGLPDEVNAAMGQVILNETCEPSDDYPKIGSGLTGLEELFDADVAEGNLSLVTEDRLIANPTDQIDNSDLEEIIESLEINLERTELEGLIERDGQHSDPVENEAPASIRSSLESLYEGPSAVVAHGENNNTGTNDTVTEAQYSESESPEGGTEEGPVE